MSRGAGLAVGAAVLAVVLGGGLYLFFSERASDRRVDAAAAGLDLASDEAGLADDFQEAAGEQPTPALQAKLDRLAKRVTALERRANRLPSDLDGRVAARLTDAAGDQRETTVQFARAVQPASEAASTLKRAGSDRKARRALRGARRTLAQVKTDLAPIERRYADISRRLTLALDGISTQLSQEDELDGSLRKQLADAKRSLRQLDQGANTNLTATRRRITTSQRSTTKAIKLIDRKLAARRRITTKRKAQQTTAAAGRAKKPAKSCPVGESVLPSTGSCYDPSPPPAGSYGGLEDFCRDQPEETECGGPGDPRGP